MNLPTSVMDIVEYDSGDGYSVLTLEGRTVGCRVTEVSLGHAEAIVSGWYMAYSNRQWVIGDFLNQCASRFGEVASQIIPFDSLMLPNAAQTLSNWASVVSQYDLTERLHALSFSHYAAVAYCPKDVRESLLQWAVENNASVAKLTAEKNNRVAVQDTSNLQIDAGHVETYAILENDQLQQIMMGNVRGLFSIIKSWRQAIQPGKKYRVVLQEIE